MVDEKKVEEVTEVAKEVTKQVLSVTASMVMVACVLKLVPVQKGLLFKAIKGIGIYGIALETYSVMYDALTKNARLDIK